MESWEDAAGACEQGFPDILRSLGILLAPRQES